VTGLDSGRQYQLWMLVKGEPRALGRFSVSSADAHLLELEATLNNPSPADDTFLVTVEPRDDMSKPTGFMVLAGSPDP
jgi:anti-sigma-K factor RskA